LYDRSEALVSELYGEDHPAMGRLLYSRAKAHRVARQFDLAIPLARRAWQIHVDHFGPDHPDTLRAANQLAAVLVEQGSGEAETALLDLVADLRRVLAGDFRLSYPLYSLAKLRLQRGDAAAAEPLFREALELQRAALSSEHWQTAQTQGQLGRCLIQLGRFDEAEALLTDSHRTLLDSFAADHPQPAAVAGYLADLAKARHRE
jgi:tetratricopeptide (TPR) repeat protein